MKTIRTAAALSALLLVASAPIAYAQTTLGGNASDNSASGGRENGTTTGAGKGTMMKSGSGAMMKSDGMKAGSMNAPVENQMDKGTNPSANGK